MIFPIPRLSIEYNDDEYSAIRFEVLEPLRSNTGRYETLPIVGPEWILR